MNVLLAYYNLLDDWEDEKNYAAFTAAKALKKSVTRIEASYPRQTKAVQDYLEKLHACEKENNPDLDLAAGYTGEVMAEIYIPEEDIWSDDLRQAEEAGYVNLDTYVKENRALKPGDKVYAESKKKANEK